MKRENTRRLWILMILLAFLVLVPPLNSLQNDPNLSLVNEFDGTSLFGEIIITNAQHLDSDRDFISDIYYEVKEKDNNWSEAINSGEYVRVAYEKNLTDGNIIDVFVRGNGSFEVYEKDKNLSLGNSGEINSFNGKWKYITLENMIGFTDIFDFKLSGSLEFDYIHDDVTSNIFPNSLSNEDGDVVNVSNVDEAAPGDGVTEITGKSSDPVNPTWIQCGYPSANLPTTAIVQNMTLYWGHNDNTNWALTTQDPYTGIVWSPDGSSTFFNVTDYTVSTSDIDENYTLTTNLPTVTQFNAGIYIRFIGYDSNAGAEDDLLLDYCYYTAGYFNDTISPTVSLNSPLNNSAENSPITFNYTSSDNFALDSCALFGNWSLSFTERIISTTANGAYSVFAIDVDGDNDIDVLSASFNDDKIAWYENNGSESFTKITISTAANGARFVFAIDIDGDNDTDVLSASGNDDKIAWYENDGSESFTERIISTTANSAYSVFAIDVDGDGDIDVLSSSATDDKIAWYENNGSESFTEHNISITADGARSVFAIDVDNDSDIDVLSASFTDDKIAWYENNGSESFTERIISTAANGARSVFAIDIDGDNDTDILSASGNDDKVAWYENNGSESFTERIISTTADSAYNAFAIDIDGDGDIDVLSSSATDDKISWYENNGSESFTERIISTTANNARSVYSIDIDGDGDIDVLSSSFTDDKIAWYENEYAWGSVSTDSSPVNGTSNIFSPVNIPDGDWKWNVQCFDLVNNSAFASANYSLTGGIDESPPVITITNPVNDSAINDDPVSLNATTDENADCEYSTNQTFNYGTGTNFTTTGSTTHGTSLGSLAESAYNYYVKCNDSLGNNNTDSNQGYVTFTVDRTLPSSITNLANQSSSSTSIYWNWTNPVSDFNSTIIYINGSNVANTSNNFYNATGLLANTNYTITVHTKDSASNVNNTDVNSTAKTSADTTPPSVFDIKPIANTTFKVNDMIEIAANVTDNTAVDIVLANVTFPNGTINQLTLTNVVGDKFNSSFSSTSLAGQYNVTFIANDTLNFVNGTETTFFSVNAAPTIDSLVLNSTDPSTNNTNENLTAFVTTSDADNDSVKVIYDWKENGSSIAVLNMPFEGGSNSTFTKDYSDNSNNATGFNGSLWQGNGGYDGFGAYKFDRANDTYFTVPDFNYSDDFTITFWFNTSALSGSLWHYVYSHGTWNAVNNVRIYFAESNGELFTQIRDSNDPDISTLSPVGLDDGNWHFYTLTVDKTAGVKLYIDGVLDSSDSTHATDSFNPETDLFIGGRSDLNTARHYNGWLDELRVYNRALSLDQIILLNNSQPEKIHSSETSVDDIWSVSATPNDGFQDGTSVLSNNLTVLADPIPVATLFSPKNNSLFIPSNINFRCNATDNVNLANLSLYITNSSNENFILNQTTNISGTTNSTNWILGLGIGDYTWNCLVYDSDGNSAFATSNRSLNVSSSGSVSVRVIQSSDDAEEAVTGPNTGDTEITSSDLEMVSDFDFQVGDQEIGLRFQNVDIPNGAVITNAYIEFEVDEVNSSTTNLRIYGEDEDNPDTFSFGTGNFNITPRTKTSDFASWDNIPAWNTVSEKQQTVDISNVVNEIVDRSGWSSGNSMIFIINGTGKRVAEAWDGESANAPLLVVNWSANNPPNVDSLVPVANSNFNVSDVIEIASNVSDDVAVDEVLANVTLPNGTINQLTLSRQGLTDKYNNSFTLPALLGQYNVTFIANDSSNNLNATETTFFVGIDSTPPAFSNVSCNPSVGDVNSTIVCNVTVIDVIGIDSVLANVTLPNGTVLLQTVQNVSDSYNFSFNVTDTLGTHNVSWFANDTSANNDSEQNTFIIGSDDDNDGVEDSSDTLVGNDSSPSTTGISTLNITIDGNANINGTFSGTHTMIFYDGDVLLVNFTHNFSASAKINLDQITVVRTTNGVSINMSGQLLSNENKSMSITDNNFVSLCVKDEEINSPTEISSSCTGSNETDLTSCLGNSTEITIGNLTCMDSGSTITASGLKHSGILGTLEEVVTSTTTPGTESSGGGGGVAALTITTQLMSEGARIVINVEGEIHYVKIIEITNTTVTINISSTPQQATLGIGEEKKFEITDDDFYDILVRLNGIENNKANITISNIHDKIPSQLFDIKFELESSSILNFSKLVAIVSFENFGTEPTPVNLLFTILNETGEEVYSERDSIVVETEEVLRKSFEDVDLPKGKYTLILTTLYNVDVVDEFRQEFRVGKGINIWILYFVVVLGIILVIFYFMRKFKKEIKKRIRDIRFKRNLLR